MRRRSSASSPLPEIDLASIAMGLNTDDEAFQGDHHASLDNRRASVTVDNVCMSEAELALQRFLDFRKKQDAVIEEAMKLGSDEYKLIRDQILEELEWQRQGIIDQRTWQQSREEDLKMLRLKLAAKRGWDAIRRYIQSLKENKEHQVAQAQWKTMFKVAKDAAQCNDKVLLDLYERYGFLGWDRRAEALPYNPMFPDKSVQLARERAIKLRQLALEKEKEFIDSLNQAREQRRLQNQLSMPTKMPQGFSSAGKNESSRQDSENKASNSNSSRHPGMVRRSVTMFNIPTSSSITQMRREQTMQVSSKTTRFAAASDKEKQQLAPVSENSSPRHRTGVTAKAMNNRRHFSENDEVDDDDEW